METITDVILLANCKATETPRSKSSLSFQNPISTPSPGTTRQPASRSCLLPPLAMLRGIPATTPTPISAESKTTSMTSSRRSFFQSEQQHQDGEMRRRVLTQRSSSRATPTHRYSLSLAMSRITETTTMVSPIQQFPFKNN